MPKIDSRAKGHAYERQLVKLFKELGWTDCVSSRSESKNTDDAGVDLCYTYPLQIQAKAWETAPSYHTVLDKMPKRSDLYNCIFHKRNHKGSVVVMSEEDFISLLKLLINTGSIKPGAVN